jgi:ABC-type multidrug transport system permease subunit
MSVLRAVFSAFLQQWKTTSASIINVSAFIGGVPIAAVLAWIAIRSDNPNVLNYILVGAPLMTIWNMVIFRVGWSLNTELNGRTLEFCMISRTPMIILMFGKALAQIAYSIPAGIIALIAMFLVTRQLPHVASYPLLFVSLCCIIIGVAIIGLLLAATMVLVGGRAGFFNAIIPLGALLTGFIFPIDRLPIGLEVVARLLPTSWAMAGIWQSIRGPDSVWSVAGIWAAFILASAVLLGITYLMFKTVEKRVRITGVLATY